jgi:hypothetical protein
MAGQGQGCRSDYVGVTTSLPRIAAAEVGSLGPMKGIVVSDILRIPQNFDYRVGELGAEGTIVHTVWTSPSGPHPTCSDAAEIRMTNVRCWQMSSPKKKNIASRIQYAALPYRISSAFGTEVLLVTSRETKRWIIPKGWPKKRKDPWESGAREAAEEAGVIGKIGREPIGRAMLWTHWSGYDQPKSRMPMPIGRWP